ncbi:MAG: ornithine carbamoyltransferase [Nitrospirota bacterium]|nr:ornithine carbamoyltransferase [Nitrospirota bacterium]
MKIKDNHSFLNLLSHTSRDLRSILDLAGRVETSPEDFRTVLEWKTVGLLFEKSSTRTRLSFESGIRQMGGGSLFLGADIQLFRGESLEDTARVMSSYLDMVIVRTFAHERLSDFDSAASIPVINGLTDGHHPCQALSDYYYLEKVFGGLDGLAVTYVGDGNNMARSLAEGAALLGVHLTLASPVDYALPEKEVAELDRIAKKHGGSIRVLSDPMEAARGARALYTDVWTSMGQETESTIREKVFRGYCIDRNMLEVAASDAIVMHCLPAYRGKEITAEVLDGPRSRVFEQAAARLPLQKAIMIFCLGKES